MASSNDLLYAGLLLAVGVGVGYVLWQYFSRQAPAASSTGSPPVSDWNISRGHPYYNTIPQGYQGQVVPPYAYYYSGQQAPPVRSQPMRDTVQNHEEWDIQYNADGSVRHVDTHREVKSLA